MSKHKAEPAAREHEPREAAPQAGAAPTAAASPAAATAPAAAAPEKSAPLSEKDIADLKAKAAQAQQYYDQLLRTAADLENYKKRAARERAEAVRYATEALLHKLLGVLDNFEMAMAAASTPNTSLQGVQAGIAMIHQQLKSVLAESGLEEIDATGKPFDHNLHEAVSQEDSAQVAEGHVIRQLRKGYKLRDRLLRPAGVVVAKAALPAPAQTADQAQP